MPHRRRAFSLVELLVVISIIAILCSFFAPVLRSARAAVFQMTSGRAAKQLSMATSIYLADYDETYPPAMYLANGQLQTWFGLQTSEGEFDGKQGILAAYMKGKLGKDSTLSALPYLGDETGLGYNYGTIGSDLHIRRNYTNFPNCENPARTSEIEASSDTVIFASSAYYSAPWNRGDGQKYRFGFFDPPSGWNGNPNVDFRHSETPIVDHERKQVVPRGRAVIAFADGRVKPMKADQLREEMFWRNLTQ